MKTTLIIGASRGIGFELAKQLTQQGHRVIASYRQNPGQLNELEVETVAEIDVTRDESVDTLRLALGDRKIDQLIHVSGILTNENMDDMNFDRIRAQFETNTLGPLRIIYGLTDYLAPNAKVGILSSRVGSLEDNGSGGMFGYRISKTAVNMVGVNLAHELKKQGIAVALLHPGLVATEMTRGNGIHPKGSAIGLINKMDELTLESTGRFWHAEGYELPW